MTISQITKTKSEATLLLHKTSKTSKKLTIVLQLQSWRLSSQKTKLDIEKRFKQLQKIQLLLNTHTKQAKN